MKLPRWLTMLFTPAVQPVTPNPLAHLTPAERQLVLKRNPDPEDLKRLGITLTAVRPPRHGN